MKGKQRIKRLAKMQVEYIRDNPLLANIFMPDVLDLQTWVCTEFLKVLNRYGIENVAEATGLSINTLKKRRELVACRLGKKNRTLTYSQKKANDFDRENQQNRFDRNMKHLKFFTNKKDNAYIPRSDKLIVNNFIREYGINLLVKVSGMPKDKIEKRLKNGHKYNIIREVLT